MKNIKTFEGFLDFFKQKYSEVDQIAVDLINELEKIKKTGINSIFIEVDKKGVFLDSDVISGQNITNINYNVTLNDAGEVTPPTKFTIGKSKNTTGELFIEHPEDLPLHKMDDVLSKPTGWDKEIQKRLLDSGAVNQKGKRESSQIFYRLDVDDYDIPIQADYWLLDDLFNLVGDILKLPKLPRKKKIYEGRRSIWDAPETSVRLSEIEEIIKGEIDKGNVVLKNITIDDLISKMDNSKRYDDGPG